MLMDGRRMLWVRVYFDKIGVEMLLVVWWSCRNGRVVGGQCYWMELYLLSMIR